MLHFAFAAMLRQIVYEKLFLDKCKAVLPAEINALAESYWANDIESKLTVMPYTLYSVEGVEVFCHTGKIHGQIGAFFPACTIPERIAALKYYLSHELFHVDYVLKKTPFSIPQNLYFELRETHMLEIIRIEDAYTIDFIQIAESSICEAFSQFLESLPDSEFVYSQEEKRNLILQKIKELEALQKDGSTPRKTWDNF